MATALHIPFKKFLPGIAWVILILVLVCTPGDRLPAPKLLLDISFDKIVHVSIFGILVLLFFYPISVSAATKQQKIKWLVISTIAVIAFGYGTELLQRFFIRNRSYDLADWAADSAGAVIFFLLCRWKLVK